MNSREGVYSLHNIEAGEIVALTLYLGRDYTHNTARGGAVEARRAHNPKVVGSNPTPATNERKEQSSDHRVRSAFPIQGEREGDLRVLLKGFILNAKVEGLSPRTIDYYEDKLGNFL